MKPEGGTLIANGMNLKDAIFWTDTAPSQFTVSFVPSRETAVLKLWNEWRDSNGVQHAWIGNAGIIIHQLDDAVLLNCSNGMGNANFDDFVVRIRVERNVIDFASRRLSRLQR